MAAKASTSLARLKSPSLRDKLKQLYQYHEPRRLVYLEYVNRTKPKKPYPSRGWFMSLKKLNIDDADRQWQNLDRASKSFYKDCAIIDSKRYRYETSQWITKLMTIDYNSDKVDLPDDLPQTPSQSSLRSLFLLQNEMNPILDRPRRAPGPFAIFVREYAACRDLHGPKLLKDSANLWIQLEEDERQRYKAMHIRLHKLYKKSLVSQTTLPPSVNKLFEELFNHDKQGKGPSRPSHLIMSKVTDQIQSANDEDSGDSSTISCSGSENSTDSLEESDSATTEKDDTDEKLVTVMSIIKDAEDYQKLKNRLGLFRYRVDFLSLFLRESGKL